MAGKDAIIAAKSRTMVFVESAHAFTNKTLYACLVEGHTLSAASKRTYLSNLRSLQTRLASELSLAIKSNNQVFLCPQGALATSTAAADGSACAAGSDDNYQLYSIIASVPAAADCVRQAAIPLRTRAAFTSAILALYKHSKCISLDTAPHLMAAKPTWDRLCAELSAELDANATRHSKLTAREERAWCTYSDLQARVAQLGREEPGSRSHLLLAFYVLWPPLRGGDAARIRIVSLEEPTRPGDDGILVWRGEEHPAELIIAQHKTEKHYGAIRRTLPPALKRVINASLQLEPRQHLFTQARTTIPFASSTAFTNYANNLLHKIMRRPVTCNTLRHSFISALDLSLLTIAQQEQLAMWMGHSVKQQAKYRRVTSDQRIESLQAADGTLFIPVRPAPAPTGTAAAGPIACGRI